MPSAASSSLRATVTERLAVDLAQRIVGGEYRPGAALREIDLTAHYGVSRHVVREVLRTLASDGLVDYASFKGARIPKLTEADARDIYQARRMVECGPGAMTLAIDLPAVRRLHDAFTRAVKSRGFDRAFDLDVAFHLAISETSGSVRATAWLEGLMRSLRLAHLVAPSFNHQVLIDSVAQHDAVVTALEAGDALAGRMAMRDHLDAAEQALISDMAAQA